jgi:peptidyl-prolyl cis-trans isomerase SurA
MVLLLVLISPTLTFAQPAPQSAQVLDRVVAVVNDQAILASDVDLEMRLVVLEPPAGDRAPLARPHALDQLISRALIQQQMRREDVQAAAPAQSDVDARLTELRRELPVCMREGCSTDAGWTAFLAAHQLTQDEVETYLRNRIEILRFIEQRFRQGIRIAPADVEAYYRNTLLPQYAPGAQVPPVEKVAPRIQEILLERQVNALFDDWLKNLRRQGDIEVLDPALETPESQAGAGGAFE